MPAELDLLIGPESHALLAAAVGSTGATLVEARPVQVDHRPGSFTTVSYAGRLAYGEHVVDETLGASTTDVSCAATDLVIDADHPGTVTVSDGDVRVTVWRMPDDPGLPGLAAACDPAAMAALLESFGVDATDLVLLQHAYRPRRRAVIEARARGGSVFVKVVRPPRVADLHARHQMLSDAGLPTPRSLGWTASGVLVVEALHGTSLRDLLLTGAGPLPTGADLVALLDGIPTQATGLPRRPSWTDNAELYADQLALALPAAGRRAADAARRVAALVAGQPDVDAVHGDFYETQLLLEGPAVSGLLDVDSCGPGRRADDLACLVGHAVVLADMGLITRAALAEVLDAWLPAFEARVDPIELRARVAGVLLSLATGPHRVQDPDWPAATLDRLDLVDAWVEAAEHGRVPV